MKRDGNILRSLFGAGLMVGAVAVAPTPAEAQVAGQWKGPEHVYAKICANCHEIGVGPVIKGRNLDPEYYISVVRHGMRAMPAFRPSELEDAMLRKVAEMLSKSPAPGGAK